jgi:hypothetical protein
MESDRDVWNTTYFIAPFGRELAKRFRRATTYRHHCPTGCVSFWASLTNRARGGVTDAGEPVPHR